MSKGDVNYMGLLDLSKFMRHARPFFAWQIELTTRCPLKCRMCIREGAVNWQGMDIKLEDFRRISEYFSKAENIILQGWGEPLLYRNLIDAVRIVKEKGARSGFVTSGSGLERAFISELIGAGTDFIGFSLAGATAQTHNPIRIPSDFELLIENIRLFNTIKKEKRLDKPSLHLAYLVLKDNITDVPALVELANHTGIHEIILINLIQVSNEWQEAQRVFSCTEEGMKTEYADILKGAEIRAKELNINLRISSLFPADVPVCEENPLRNLYVSVEGEVSPCVYLNPPLPGPIKKIYCGKEFQTGKAGFGNILQEPFDTIWGSAGYAEFRKCFEKRLKHPKALSLSDTQFRPPVPCRTCHKMLGL